MANQGWEKHIHPFAKDLLLGNIPSRPNDGIRMVGNPREATPNHKIMGRGVEYYRAIREFKQDKDERNKDHLNQARGNVLETLILQETDGLWQNEMQCSTPHGELWLQGMGFISLAACEDLFQDNIAAEIKVKIKKLWQQWAKINYLLSDHNRQIYSPGARFKIKNQKDVERGPFFAGASHVLREILNYAPSYDWKRLLDKFNVINLDPVAESIKITSKLTDGVNYCVVIARLLKNKYNYFNSLEFMPSNLVLVNTNLRDSILVGRSIDSHEAIVLSKRIQKEFVYHVKVSYNANKKASTPNSIITFYSMDPVEYKSHDINCVVAGNYKDYYLL
jgi:hypothetical protein